MIARTRPFKKKRKKTSSRKMRLTTQKWVPKLRNPKPKKFKLQLKIKRKSAKYRS